MNLEELKEVVYHNTKFNIKLIGFTGQKGVGKTTTAHYLDGNVFSLATPIKKMLSTLVNPIYIYEEKEKPIPGWPKHLTGRFLLQTLGTEWGRTLWSDIWVTQLLDEIKEVDGLCIIDDVRFENEANAIRKQGGLIYKIIRGGVENNDSHVSEHGLPKHLIDDEVILDV